MFGWLAYMWLSPGQAPYHYKLIEEGGIEKFSSLGSRHGQTFASASKRFWSRVWTNRSLWPTLLAVAMQNLSCLCGRIAPANQWSSSMGSSPS